MSPENDDKNKGTDFSDYARDRESSQPAGRDDPNSSSTGGRILRGCAIALGIAALVFLFLVGACFMAL